MFNCGVYFSIFLHQVSLNFQKLFSVLFRLSRAFTCLYLDIALAMRIKKLTLGYSLFSQTKETKNMIKKSPKKLNEPKTIICKIGHYLITLLQQIKYLKKF